MPWFAWQTGGNFSRITHYHFSNLEETFCTLSEIDPTDDHVPDPRKYWFAEVIKNHCLGIKKLDENYVG